MAIYEVVTNILIVILFAVAFNKSNHHQPGWAVIVVLIGSVATTTSYLFAGNSTYTFITIGSTQVHSGDIVLIWMLLYCIVKVFSPIRVSFYLKSTLLLIVPIAVSLMRGVINGTMGSANFLSDTRKYIAFLVCLLAFYFIYRDTEEKEDFTISATYVARYFDILVTMTLIVWALDLGIGLNSLPGQINGTLSDGGSTFRIVTPSLVIILAFYTLYMMYDNLKNYRVFKGKTLIFTAVVILLQWRTVVAAFLIGILLLVLYFLLKEKTLSRGLIAQFFAIVIAGGFIYFISGAGNSVITSMLSNLFESYSSVNSNTGTFSTRTEVWNMLLGSLNGINVALGQPFGTAYADSVTWTNSAHSGYVDYIMKMGYVGIVCLILFVLIIAISGIRQKKPLISIIMVAILVYWIGYGLGPELGAVIGICLAILDNELLSSDVVSFENEDGVDIEY